MGRINQALVQERLLMGTERGPMVLLLTGCSFGVVVDFDFGLMDTLIGLMVFFWGWWSLRRIAAYDPRFFRNVMPKILAAIRLRIVHAMDGKRRPKPWSFTATPMVMRRQIGEPRPSKLKFWM